jgi:hypothetical protein
MPKLGLGLSLPQTRVAGGFTPKKLSGLSLWLKADAGVSTSQSQYVSKVVLSGAGESVFNATYNAISTPDNDGTYYFTGTNGKTMIFIGPMGGGPEYQVYDDGYVYPYVSYDGVNWGLTGTYRPVTITISESSSVADGTYTYDGFIDNSYYSWSKGTYHIHCTPGDQFILRENSYGDLARSSQYFGGLPTGQWDSIEWPGEVYCVSTVGSYFPTGAVPTGVTTISGYGPVNVNSWADQSGNGNNVTVPDGGTPPVFESSQINGKPAIYSEGEGTIGLGTDQINLNQFTVFVVQKPFGNTARRGFSNIGYNGGNVLIGAWENSGDVYTRTCYGGYGWVYQDLYTQQFVWHLDIMTSSTITNLSSYWQDGVNYATTADVANILDGVSIGADEYHYGQIGSGKIQYAEFVLYNRILSEPERQQVEAYLNSKYAIY